MDKIRLATIEETKSIAAQSDLGPSSSVLAFENAKTGRPDLAVLRSVTEIDPVFFDAESSAHRKAIFIWAVENTLRVMGGVPAYYFNVSPADAEWRETVEKWGAETVSKAPELRYKKFL